MRLGPVSEIFSTIPRYHFFKSKNRYTGSKGNMRYCIIPAEELTVFIWHGSLCYEKAEIEAEKSFENSEEGFLDAIAFLEDYYKTDDEAKKDPWSNYKGWTREKANEFQLKLAQKKEEGIFE